MTRLFKPGMSPLSPDDRLEQVPYAFRHSSASLGWTGLRVEHDTRQPGSEFVHPPLTGLWLVLTGHIAPQGTDHRCDDARFSGEGAPQAMNLLPPGIESQWRWRNTFDFTDSTHYQLTPELVTKVAEEAFGLDPTSLHFPVRYYDRSCPEIIGTLSALRRELLIGAPGGRLYAESLSNVLVVQLIRHLSTAGVANRQPCGNEGRLARSTLQTVQEYIHAHLDQNIALSDLAAVANLSEFHFARLFKLTTGLPPYRFVIHQRVERAKLLILEGRLSLAQIAFDVGFSDQSQLSRHFKKIVGVTPKQFN